MATKEEFHVVITKDSSRYFVMGIDEGATLKDSPLVNYSMHRKAATRYDAPTALAVSTRIKHVLEKQLGPEDELPAVTVEKAFADQQEEQGFPEVRQMVREIREEITPEKLKDVEGEELVKSHKEILKMGDDVTSLQLALAYCLNLITKEMKRRKGEEKQTKRVRITRKD
jgi:hypothetical protein